VTVKTLDLASSLVIIGEKCGAPLMSRQWLKVSLSRHRVKISGKTYRYWCLRWFGSDGRQRGESIGRVDGPHKLSHRQAELKRFQKEHEINRHPGRRDISRDYTLESFLADYISSRTPELAPGTLELHKLTAKYLLEYFGKGRRIIQITKADARAFKTALAKGELANRNRRGKTPRPATVERSIREARTMFGQALQDDLILSNPFNRLSKTIRVKKDWHYVGLDELYRLLQACPNGSWRILLALCRFAGLRQGEALSLTWRDIDWDKNCLKVWSPKTRRSRRVPIVPELLPLLSETFDSANEGEKLVAPKLCKNNLWRDFQVIRKNAGGVKPYKKWCQTLRKNREQDWNEKFPSHVVSEWMGHSETVARSHYLKVDDRNMKAATETVIDAEVAQKLAQKSNNILVDKEEKIV